MNSDATGANQGGREQDLLLLPLIVSIAILPIQFHLLKYVILALFLAVCSYVLIARRRHCTIPYSPIYVVVGLLIAIFLTWGIRSVWFGNRLDYALKDAAGFFVYLTFPFVFSYVVIRRAADKLINSIILAAIVVASIHIGAFAVFYLIFDRVTFPSLAAANSFLSAIGFTWELGSTGGVLRANTKAGHYILFGLGLLCYRYVKSRRPMDLVLAAVLLMGALLDGHRALIVAIAIFGILVFPVILRLFESRPLSTMAPAVLGGLLLLFTFVMFIDFQGWWARFGDLSSPGLSVRTGQIGSLIAEIDKHPVFGSGFGASANIIRSPERPFMYEVDFLAVIMKLGLVGAILYFSIYLGTIVSAFLTFRSLYGYVVMSIGMSYFFYMGTNGGFAMSPISSFFHVLLFCCVAIGLQMRDPFSRGSDSNQRFVDSASYRRPGVKETLIFNERES